MASPTLDEFMREVGPRARDAGATDRELRQYWASTYGGEHIDRFSLPTWEDFKPSIQRQQPDIPEEDIRSYWEENYGDFGAREKDQGDVGRGFSTAFQQLPQLAGGFEAGAGAVGEHIFGEGGLFTALKEHGLRNYREIEQEIAQESKPSDSITEAYKMARAGNPGALVDWLQHTLGYGGAQALQMLATAGIGYVGGKLALKTIAEATTKLVAKESARLTATPAGSKLAGDALTKQAVSNVAGKMGQLGALAATAVGMEGGEIFGGLVDKATKEGRSLTGAELAKATGTMLAAGGVEFVGDVIDLDLILGRSLAKSLATSRLGHAGAASAVGTAKEGGTEFTQTLLEEFGKGNDPFSPESITRAVDAAAVGGVTGGTMGTIGGLLARPEDRTIPTVTERQPEDMGLTPDALPPQTTRPITGPPQPGEGRAGTAYGAGPVLDVSPLPTVSSVLNARDLNDAIMGAVGVVQGATETAKARAAEFAKMTAKAKNETDALLARAPQKRAGTDIPILSGPAQAAPSLFDQPSPIVPGQAFTPRAEPEADPRQRLAEERARMVAERERRRLEQPTNQPIPEPVQAAPSVDDTPVPSRADLAYPSSKQVRDLIHEKGFHLDTPVFRDILKQAVGKETFADLTPRELQTLADKIQRVKAPQPPAQTQEAPPQAPLTPRPEQPSAPVTTIPEAQVPRSELTPEKNAEILLRAEKAKADMEIAGTERGGRFFREQQGAGSTQNVIGLAPPTADWYKDLTTGPSPAIRGDRKQSARQKIEDAIAKIIEDEGLDRGKAVEHVKAALLRDREFHQTEWGRDLNSILQGEWPSWVERPGEAKPQEGPSSHPGYTAGRPQAFQDVPRGTPQVSVEEQEKQKMEGAKPQNALDLIDRLYRDILDDTKVVHAMQREQKERWATVKRVDRAMKDSLRSGMDYDEAARQIPAGDLAALAAILDGKTAPQVETKPAVSEAPPIAPGTDDSEPFSLTAPTVKQAMPKEEDRQTALDLPPPTVGERPIIGRETTPEESPLFSKAVQTPEAEQTAMPEGHRSEDDILRERRGWTQEQMSTAVPQKEPWQMTALEYTRFMLPESLKGKVTTAQRSYEAQHRKEIRGATDRGETIPPEVLADYPDLRPREDLAQAPTDRIDPAEYARIPDGTMVSVMAIRRATGDEVTVREEARTALTRIDETLTRYRRLLECVSA